MLGLPSRNEFRLFFLPPSNDDDRNAAQDQNTSSDRAPVQLLTENNHSQDDCRYRCDQRNEHARCYSHVLDQPVVKNESYYRSNDRQIKNRDDRTGGPAKV